MGRITPKRLTPKQRAVLDKVVRETPPVHITEDGQILRSQHMLGVDDMTDGDLDELRTQSGKMLTEEDIQQLADEAERGYDVSHLVKPKGKGKTRR